MFHLLFETLSPVRQIVNELPAERREEFCA
jgi:hypothetical protein